MIEVGATVGNYRVMQKIGQGAMGAVFLAVHPVIGKRVALKVIHPELATNEEMVSRFFNEARAVTQIGHQNIVDVQDFGQTPDGDSFIVLELLEGESLGDRLKAEGPLSVPRALHIAGQLADGLAAAHARGVIHRDLKPDNVILIERGGDKDFVKILDFGLAKLLGPGGMQHKTKTGSLLGTPHYMAPEQAEGKQIDHRVDVYALGCMMFQLLTGRVPFPGDGFGEVLVKHLREPPPLPSRLNPAVPKSVEKIVLHALAKKPDFRFKSMDDFRAALRDPERFEQKLDADDPSKITGETVAPQMTPVALPGPAPVVAPPAAPTRLPQDAPTVVGQAPPAVEAALAKRAQPGRAPAPTVAEPLSPRRRGRPDDLDRPARTSGPIVLAVVAGLVLLGAIGAVVYYVAGGGTVTVALSTVPSGAEVLDGTARLGETPLTLRLPRGDAPVRLTFRKEGFLQAVRAVTPAGDQALDVRLLPMPVEEPPAEPAEPPAPEPPPPTAPPPVAKGPRPPRQAASPPVAKAPDRAPAAVRKKPAKKGNPDTLLLTPSF